MFCKIKSLGLSGIEPYIVSVEVDSRRGLPGFDIVGLPDLAIKESRERIKSALQNLGYPPLSTKIVANLAPADTRKQGSVYDLPVLLALTCAAGYEQFNFGEDTAVIGEIGLSGELRGVTGVLAMIIDACRMGLRRVIVPIQNAVEASAADGVEVLCATHTSEIIDWCKNKGTLTPARNIPAAPQTLPEFLDLADVKGQEEAKRAMEVAAAGGHNILLIGAPGTGKSMLAKRLPSILPQMNADEAIEATKIHSIAGYLPEGTRLLAARPFRAPHHSMSAVALAGGGVNPRPGEISLAHRGVLFLDELPEFPKNVLETLRQPLEDRKVYIARAAYSVGYPADIMLVCAMNPCHCGFYGHPTKKCTCTPQSIAKYLGKISGPLLDRIDIHIEVSPMDYEQITSSQPRESSAQVRERVSAAREIQNERYKGTAVKCNAEIPPALLDEVCKLENAAKTMLGAAFNRLGLSARGYDRILKVSRTIADLDGSQLILSKHISQAIQFRSLDRKYWGAGN